jgi:hypothetical protein
MTKIKPKRATLYLIELHGIRDHAYMLVEKEILEWILSDVPPPPKLLTAWKKEGHREYKDEPYSSTRPNDRALNVSPVAKFYFSDTLEYAIWHAKNLKKYHIEPGFYGGIY